MLPPFVCRRISATGESSKELHVEGRRRELEVSWTRTSRGLAVLLALALPNGCGERRAEPAVSETDAGDLGGDLGAVCARTGSAVEGEDVSNAAVFADGALRVVRTCFFELTPAYPTWADGRRARRWIFLPPGKPVDGTDPEHFVFPIGTRALKLYSDGERPIELRVLEHRQDGWRMGSYVFDATGAHATYTERGGRDALGLDPPHDIPSSAQCGRCHGGEPGRLLAFSAFQLSRGGTPTVQDLVARGLLHLPANAAVAAPFGDAVVERALGGLHASCAHCHSSSGEQSVLGLDYRMSAFVQRPEDTATYRTNVGVALTTYSADRATLRVQPGRPDQSGTFLRLPLRGAGQMPPMGTRVRNVQLEADTEAWIHSLAP